MNAGTAVLLWIVSTSVLLYLLFLVVRGAVEQGVRQALRDDLLRPDTWALVEQRRQEREQAC